MADVISNFYPVHHVDPGEPGLVAAYTFSANELAQFGRYLNRARSGAIYDLTTSVGTPIIGQGGGVYVHDAVGSYWQGTSYSGGSRIRALVNVTSAPAGTRAIFQNGNRYLIYLSSANQPYISLDGGVTYTGWLTNISNRGPVLIDGWLTEGLMQRLYANGTYCNQGGPVTAGATAGYMQCGRHSEIRMAAVYDPASARITDAQIRASYVRDFARHIIWQWTPRDVGEGPAGGILTGSHSGVGGWTCPLGASTMSFVWRADLSIPSGGRLCLTDTQTTTLNRIDFEYGSRPWFGSYLIEYQVRNPASDNLVVGWLPIRGADPTAAGSASYWVHVRPTGGVYRSSVYYANSTEIVGVDMTTPAAGDRCAVLVTRHPSGDIRVYSLGRNGWTACSAAVNHVTSLSEGCMTVAPRGAYVERVTMFQGEMMPEELRS